MTVGTLQNTLEKAAFLDVNWYGLCYLKSELWEIPDMEMEISLQLITRALIQETIPWTWTSMSQELGGIEEAEQLDLDTIKSADFSVPEEGVKVNIRTQMQFSQVNSSVHFRCISLQNVRLSHSQLTLVLSLLKSKLKNTSRYFHRWNLPGRRAAPNHCWQDPGVQSGQGREHSLSQGMLP